MSKATAQKSQSKKATTRRHLQSASKRKTTPFAIASQFVSSPKGRITVLGAVLTLTCLWLTNTDTNYSFRWLNLTLWMGAVASFFYVCKEKWAKYSGHTKLYVVYSRDTGTRKTTKANKHSWLYRNLAITSVFALTTLLSFLWLTAYPFAGDSVGTIGMNAFGIVNGDIKNIFGTGPSEAFGMISLLFNSAFFTFFGNNLSAMRVPTALIGIADVCLLFLVVRTNFNTRTAVWTSLVMSLLPLHMYFARVNTTAAYASFWTTAILGAFLWALNKRTILSYGMLGITLGVAAGFNFDVRLMGMTTLVATIGLCLYQGFTTSFKKTQFSAKVGLLVAMCFVGYGPQVWQTTENTFFGVNRTPILQGGNPVGGNLTTAVKQIPRSLAMYVNEPIAQSTVMGNSPILPNYGMAFFFVVGFLTALFTANSALRMIATFAVTLPIFNFAFSNRTGDTERTALLFPIISFLTAFGVVKMVEYFGQWSVPNSEKTGRNFMGSYDPAGFLKRNKMVARFFSVVTVLAAGYFMALPAVKFFKNEVASNVESGNATGSLPTYLMNFVVQTIKSDKLANEANLCLQVNEANAAVLNLPQNQDYFRYFMPKTRVTVQALANANSSDAYVAKNCSTEIEGLTWRKAMPCESYQRFSCPKDGSQFNIYTDSNLTELSWN